RVDPLTFVTLDMTTVYAPDDKLSFGIQYDFHLPNSAKLTPRLDYSYRSEIQTNAINLPTTLIDEVGIVNFRLAWQSPDDQWSAGLSVTNVTDEFYYESMFGNGQATNFSQTSRPGWPREAFVTIKRSF